MKKTTILTLLLIVAGLSHAQKTLSVGLETGITLDRFDFMAENGTYLSQRELGGKIGLNLSLNKNQFTFETGLMRYNSNTPDFFYNHKTNTPEKTYSSSGSNQMYLIPLRFGKEFINRKNNLYLKPEIGVFGLVNRFYQNGSTSSSYSSMSIYSETDTLSDKFTKVGYEVSKFNLGFETSLIAGYRFKEKVDFFLKGTVQNTLKPISYRTEIHSKLDDSEMVKGITSFGGNSIFISIGLKYNFDLSKKE